MRLRPLLLPLVALSLGPAAASAQRPAGEARPDDSVRVRLVAPDGTVRAATLDDLNRRPPAEGDVLRVQGGAASSSVQGARARAQALRGGRPRRVVQPVIVVTPPPPVIVNVPGGGAAPVYYGPTYASPAGYAPGYGPAPSGATTTVVLPNGAAALAPTTPADSAALPRPTPPVVTGLPRLGPVPAPVPEARVREVERSILELGLFRAANVNFEFAKATLLEGTDETLDAVGEVLRRHPEVRVEVGGHTDNVGTDATNQRLSERRAETVRRYLTERWGIDAGRIVARGYGEGQPLSTNANPTGRALNRRVEFRVLR